MCGQEASTSTHCNNKMPSTFDSLYFLKGFLTSLSRVMRTTSSTSWVMMASHDGNIPELSI